MLLFSDNESNGKLKFGIKEIDIMAVKGAIAKEQVIKELLTYFGERAFKYDKDIRVNCIENGEPVQIKIALTASKVVVEQGGDAAVPGSVAPTVSAIPKSEMIDFEAPAAPAPVAAPTAEEKQNIKELMAKLGL
jgi:hypothetical protein